ncbi:hypothetical protein AB4Z42_08570 [Mycobacterium sp. 2YAF39]|uniref:hypothetical protein n=1 Tax=Mycobacterium sp. 2YAF39 TaxID=3233033 RepID=UPI003F99CB8A
MAITLCVPPRPGELCAPIRYLLRKESVVIELTSRHRVTEVDWDSGERAVAVVVEITDPATSRPVDVRFDIVRAGDIAGNSAVSARSRRIGSVDRDGDKVDVYGTYLGVVADEN